MKRSTIFIVLFSLILSSWLGCSESSMTGTSKKMPRESAIGELNNMVSSVTLTRNWCESVRGCSLGRGRVLVSADEMGRA